MTTENFERNRQEASVFQLGYTDCSPLLEASLCAAAEEMLPPWRAEKVRAARHLQDKAQAAGVGLLLCHMLLQAGIERYALNEYTLQRHGKPELIYGTVPTGDNSGGKLYFNLSHSGRYAACIVGRASCGVDIEQVREGRAYTRIAERFFCDNEKAYLNSESGSRAFYKIWTMKESYMKYTGRGFALPPSRVYSDLKRCRVWADDLPEASFRWFEQENMILCTCLHEKAEVQGPERYDVRKLLRGECH